MDKESAEYIVKLFQFLKGRRITIKNTDYRVNDVYLAERENEWEPIAKCIQKGSDHEEHIILDHFVRRELSVMLAEVDSLEYNEKGCARLHAILQDIYREIPVKTENHRILEELKPYLGYWAAWDNDNGREAFEKVKNLLLSHVRGVAA